MAKLSPPPEVRSLKSKDDLGRGQWSQGHRHWWAFKEGVRPVIAAWFGKQSDEQGSAPTPLFSYYTESSLLTQLHSREAIISFEAQKDMWLHEDRDQSCNIIGKFTQEAKAEGKRLNRRLVTN